MTDWESVQEIREAFLSRGGESLSFAGKSVTVTMRNDASRNVATGMSAPICAPYSPFFPGTYTLGTPGPEEQPKSTSLWCLVSVKLVFYLEMAGTPGTHVGRENLEFLQWQTGCGFTSRTIPASAGECRLIRGQILW